MQKKLLLIPIIALAILIGYFFYNNSLQRSSPYSWCDLDHNSICDDADRQLFSLSFGKCVGDPDFNFNADISGDSCVDTADERAFNSSFPAGSIKNLIESLCENGSRLYFDDGARYPMQVRKCGDYFGVYPPRDLMDAPVVMVGKNGTYALSCGGMPGPEGYAPSECDNITCDDTNLCSGIEIDCSRFQYKATQEDKYTGRTEEWYTNMRDLCNLENYVRMNDTRYCTLIVSEDAKARCGGS